MKKNMYRIIISIAACSMLAAVLTYSRAMAENPGDTYEEANICTSADTAAFEEEAPMSTAVAPEAEDGENLRCTFGVCGNCPEDHPAGPFFCNPLNGCCAPL